MAISTPIIFIHQGKANYLPYALGQAQFSCPNAQIILLGTKENQSLIKSPLLKNPPIFPSIADYSVQAREFGQVYFHQSNNSYDYELFCFQRWFVLLYSPLIKEDYADYAWAGLIYGQQMTSLHTAYFTQNALYAYCQLCLAKFKEKNTLIQLYKEKNASITGMTMAGLFSQSFVYPAQNLAHIFDSSLIENDGIYETTWEHLKKVVWIKHHPYFVRTDNHQLIPTHSIHFQCDSKRLIACYYRGHSGWLYRYLAYLYYYVLRRFVKFFIQR